MNNNHPWTTNRFVLIFNIASECTSFPLKTKKLTDAILIEGAFVWDIPEYSEIYSGIYFGYSAPSRMEIQVFRNKNSSQTNAYSHYYTWKNFPQICSQLSFRASQTVITDSISDTLKQFLRKIMYIFSAQETPTSRGKLPQICSF